MDAKSPIGTDQAASPKQMVLMAICGCTAMDVVSLLKKYKEPLKSLKVNAEADLTDSYPKIFKSVLVEFFFEGEINPARVIEAVELSQSKYCGVSAMIAKACPVNYIAYLNDKKLAEGSSRFP